jgi:hypothetical protein
MSPQDALAFVLAWLDTGPDDEMLGRAALTQLEPLVDWHWAAVSDELIHLMATRPDLRRVVDGCMFDPSGPSAVQQALWRAAKQDQ